MEYIEKLRNAQTANNSWLCVGLDPDPQMLRVDVLKWDEPVLPFNKAIIDATVDVVCAYKPNLGFYLQWGAAGIIALERTLAYIPRHIPIVLDCKTGDIGHTQKAWANGLFDVWNVDAVTVNPYVGEEAVMPMIEKRPDKAVYILARTSNPSATQFQGNLGHKEGLSADVLQKSQEWQTEGHKGYVVGATYPEELAVARSISAESNFLIPGIGKQGGSLAAAVKYGPDNMTGPLISASRSVIYANMGVDFALNARNAAVRLRDEINLMIMNG
ncbi:MAG: orotidine-5'-phosphate decarboxylase [Candidatus Promineifilaceae bacterium]|nr:orotidine-5'-phosphate decarboxylase [Candidatus Promineifilaceae bacterium]